MQTLLQPNIFLTRKDAARVLAETGLPVRESTLERLALREGGPEYRLINGRALYTRAWLEAWVRQQLDGQG